MEGNRAWRVRRRGFAESLVLDGPAFRSGKEGLGRAERVARSFVRKTEGLGRGVVEVDMMGRNQ